MLLILFINNINNNGSFNNIHNITNNGYNITFGRNKAHNNKNCKIKNANDDELNLYKKRGLSENFFGNIQRYPLVSIIFYNVEYNKNNAYDMFMTTS